MKSFLWEMYNDNKTKSGNTLWLSENTIWLKCSNDNIEFYTYFS